MGSACANHKQHGWRASTESFLGLLLRGGWDRARIIVCASYSYVSRATSQGRRRARHKHEKRVDLTRSTSTTSLEHSRRWFALPAATSNPSPRATSHRPSSADFRGSWTYIVATTAARIQVKAVSAHQSPPLRPVRRGSPASSNPRSCFLRREKRLGHEPQPVHVSDLDIKVGDLGQGHPLRALDHLIGRENGGPGIQSYVCGGRATSLDGGNGNCTRYERS